MTRAEKLFAWTLECDGEFLKMLGDIEPDQRLPAIEFFHAKAERDRYTSRCDRCARWTGQKCRSHHKPRHFHKLAPGDDGAGWRAKCGDFDAGI